jgi:Fur family transcriptional regulator, peroxide stress response regulator
MAIPLENLIHSLKDAKLRLTPQRIAIYELLTTNKEHPTSQMIYEELRPKFPSLSLATVYNTLEELVALGVINALGSAGDGSVHYDADLSPHVNLACLSCHRVIDLASEHIQQVEHEVANTSGYQLFGARVLYYGLCPDCQKAKQNSTDRE